MYITHKLLKSAFSAVASSAAFSYPSKVSETISLADRFPNVSLNDICLYFNRFNSFASFLA